MFSSNLPVSAVNLGLGANSFPGEQDKGLVGLVEQNITLFLQQTFREPSAHHQAWLQKEIESITHLHIACRQHVD